MKTFLRFLSNHKLYAIAEIVGMSIALAFVILVGSYILEVSRCDVRTSDSRDVYLCHVTDSPAMNGDMSETLMSVAGIKDCVTFWKTSGEFSSLFAQRSGKDDIQVKAVIASSNFFEFFGFPLESTSSSDALSSKSSVVISREFADKVFPGEDPVGQILRIHEGEGRFSVDASYTVSGVQESGWKTVIPQADVVIRFDNYDETLSGLFATMRLSRFHFVKIDPYSDMEHVRLVLSEMTYPSPFPVEEPLHYGLEPLRKINNYLVSFPEYDLHKYFDNLYDYKLFKVFLLSCILLLLFAIMNYVSLSTAYSRFRLREMATRSLLGAEKKGVAARCFAESFFLLGISFLLGLIIVFAIKNPVSSLLQVVIHPLGTFSDWLMIAVCFIVIGGIAGFIPALTVSRNDPVKVIKGEFRFKDKAYLGKVIIAVQSFVCMGALCACAALVIQTHKMVSVPRGYDPHNIISIETKRLMDNPLALGITLDDLKALPFVETVGMIDGNPTKEISCRRMFSDGLSLLCVQGDMGAFKVLGIELLEKLSDYEGDGGRIYICKSSAEEFFEKKGDGPLMDDGEVYVCGVIEDLKIGDVNTEGIGGMLAFEVNNKLSLLGINYKHPILKVYGNEKEALKSIKQLYKDAGVEDLFDISSLTQQINSHYSLERRSMGILLVFALLSILLTSLGIVALSSYWSRLQVRDVSVKKIFGIAREDVFRGTVASFLLPSLFGAIAAIPFAYIYIGRWLSKYTVHIDNSLLLYIVPLALVLLIVLAFICPQAVRLMNTNPAEVLKKE